MAEAAEGLILAQLGRAALLAVLEDWSRVTGIKPQVVAVDALTTAESDMLATGLGQGGVVVSTRSKDRRQGTLAIHFPMPVVRRGIAALAGEANRSETLLRPEELDVFRELASRLCTACNELLRSMDLGLQMSDSVEDLRLFQVHGNGPKLALELTKARVGGVRLLARLGAAEVEVLLIVPRMLVSELLEAYLRNRPAA
jgi:hypothetical protein